MPPTMAPPTGTTASRSSGGSGDSDDSNPGNISGQDSASAAPPDDGESSMVPRRDRATRGGRAPCLREGQGGDERRGGDEVPGGRASHSGSPPAGGPGDVAHLRA